MNERNGPVGIPESTPEGGLERIGAALHAGDRDAVMACFATDATLSLMSGEDRITITGAKIREAVDALFTGFDDLRMTPTSRHLLKTGVVEEAVVSGDHVGVFAAAEPTSRRVRINVRLSATWGPDSTLGSLWVEPDTRALFVQIAESNDVVGVTGGLNALARERYDGALQITDDNNPRPKSAAAAFRRQVPPRHRWIAAMTVAAALLTTFVVWRTHTSTGGAADAQAVGKATTTATATARATTPAARRTPATPPAPPVIAKTNPRAVPRVQAGKQVVLSSDVLFAFDSAAVTPAATAALNHLARQVRGAKVTGTIQINGYTDNLGDISYDSALSRTRALAVARVLQRALVGTAVTLVPQGFGHANPIATNTTDAGRARNRRVAIVLPTPR